MTPRLRLQPEAVGLGMTVVTCGAALLIGAHVSGRSDLWQAGGPGLAAGGLALLIGLATRPKAEATTGENAAAAAPPAAHETPAAIVAPTQLPHQPSPWTQALDEDDDELFDDVELVVAQSSGGRR